MIAGDGTSRKKLKRLRTAIQTSSRHWNRAAGILRPWKKFPILKELAIPLLNSLDLQYPLGLRDSLLFCLSLSTGARAMEVANITWKDVTVLDGGKAVLLNIRPTKNSTELGSTHSSQFGRRSNPKVYMSSILVLIHSLNDFLLFGVC